ncbi:MAG: hypothetical protein M3P12_03110 [Gemmatimonadota bacterium]|nr:hypothetical protein [Gemmatimonadota bacterium]
MEAITIVCDYGDGRVAAEQVTMTIRGRRLVVDLCDTHLRELTRNARPPRRGRRTAIGAASSAKRRGRPPGNKNKAISPNGPKKTAAKKSPAKRHGRPRKTAAKAKA